MMFVSQLQNYQIGLTPRIGISPFLVFLASYAHAYARTRAAKVLADNNNLKYPSGKANGHGFRLAMDASNKNIKRMKPADGWFLTQAVVAEKTEPASVRPNRMEEIDIVVNPTKDMLVGVWQACGTNDNGDRIYGVNFKILEKDGTFMNISVKNRQNARFGLGGNGAWTFEDGCLVETIDSKSSNIFGGKSNAMELTLSDNGNLMHIIWVNTVTGARVDEYFEKVK